MKSSRKPQPPVLSPEAVRTPAEMNCAPKECYLRSYEDIRHIGHADLQLRYPLLLDVVVWGRVYHWEADQEHIRVGVGQGSQLVVVLLQGENGRVLWGGGKWWVKGTSPFWGKVESPGAAQPGERKLKEDLIFFCHLGKVIQTTSE